MRYRIEYAGGRCCNFANSRADLLSWLKLLKDEEIIDIRKLYKSGVSDSVMGTYRQYIGKNDVILEKAQKGESKDGKRESTGHHRGNGEELHDTAGNSR